MKLIWRFVSDIHFVVGLLIMSAIAQFTDGDTGGGWFAVGCLALVTLTHVLASHAPGKKTKG